MLYASAGQSSEILRTQVEPSRYAAGKTELLRLRRTRAEGLVLHWPFTQDPRRLPTVRRALVRGKPSTLNL
jgi:hypothetical protein